MQHLTLIQVRKRLRYVTVLCVVFSHFSVFAQSEPHYSLQILDRYQFNPAFAGMEASLSITGNYRGQWLGIEGNPVQKYVNAHMPFYLWRGALGISVEHESIGAQKKLNTTVSYNYVLETEFGLFSAGIAAGFTQQSLDGSLLRTPDGDYEGPTILHNDPILPNTVVHGIAPLFHAGVYFAGDYFEAGIAVQGYTPGNIRLDNIEIRDKAAVNLFAEYIIDATPEISVYPAVFVISDLSQTQMSLAIRGEYKGLMTLGFGLRGYSGNTLDAMTMFGGLRVSENLRLTYAYDLSLSALRRSTEGSHELMLRYNLNKVIGAGLPPPVIYSPRF